ncbi:MAG: ATP-binding protein, partial [Hymenobacter sp.]
AMGNFSGANVQHDSQANGCWPVLIKHGTPAFGLPFLDENAELTVEKTGLTIQLKDGSKRIPELNSQFAQVLMQSIFDSVRYHFATRRHGVAPAPVDTDVVRQKIIRLVDAYVERLNNYLPYYSPIQAVRSSEYFQVYYQASQDQFTIKGLALEYQLSDEWISFRMLSDGTKRMMFILAEIFAPEEVRFNESTNEVTISLRQKIILLEEPELGIHPHQLHLLLNLIREVSREHQVIMTTHSPQVLDMLSEKELDRITICSLDPKKGTQFRKLSRAKQAQARRYMKEELHLSDYWRYSYLEDEE